MIRDAIDAIDAIRVLAGDALIAVGDLIRGGSDNFDVWPDDCFAADAMEFDVTDATQPISLDDIRRALADLPDSVLVRAAAVVMRESTYTGMPNPLCDALFDRAAQFEATESEVDAAATSWAKASHLTDLPRRGK